MSKARSRWNPQTWGPGPIFLVDVLYTAVLVLLLISWHKHWLGFAGMKDPLGGFLPVGVPWFGALGALTISLFGVADHQGDWNTRWNFWHLTRPVVGMILGTMAFLIFLAAIKASTSSSSSAVSTGVNAIPYFAISFAVGFREETFRSLITKLIDTLLTPGDSAPSVSFGPSPVLFNDVAVNQALNVVVTLTNTGSASLTVAGDTPTPAGLSIVGDQFGIIDDVVTGASINAGASATFTVRFAPTRTGAANGSVTLRCNAGTFVIPLEGNGV